MEQQLENKEFVNTALDKYEAFKARIAGIEKDMLYDKASDLVVILNYASGRSLIYKGHKMNELKQLSDEELKNHPDAVMCMANNSELEESTPAELFQSVIDIKE